MYIKQIKIQKMLNCIDYYVDKKEWETAETITNELIREIENRKVYADLLKWVKSLLSGIETMKDR